MNDKLWSVCLMCALTVLAPGCASDGDGDMSGSDANALGAANPDGKPGDEQTPPTTNGADVEAWLERGDYENWACETTEHPQMKVSPHGFNRICSNDLAAGFTGQVGDERPLNTASVKELYNDASELVGVAVAVKIKSGSNGGDNWYWYERVPLDSGAPHNEAGVVADGLGSAGTAKTICVGCHGGAGSDEMHALTGSSDFVYLQVLP